MKTKTYLGTLLVINFILCANFIYSQVPMGFSYQTIVRDANGNLIENKDVSFRFTLTDANESIYYVETHSLKTSLHGVANVIIGKGNVVQGTISTVPWNSTDVLLKVELDPEGGFNFINLGSSKLYSVPYALFAANGPTGPVGPAGNGISKVIDNGDGTLTFEFDNGYQYISPNLKGPQGEVGPIGPQGIQGASGPTGPQGIQGLTGPIGLIGPQGIPGPKGEKGDAGTGLTNRGGWSSGTNYNPGDYVFSQSKDDPTVNSMWIAESSSTFLSTILPKDDPTKWVEFEAPQGPEGLQGLQGEKGEQGPIGPQGPQGIQGQIGPVGPQGTVGPQGLQGVSGTNGISIQWIGSLQSVPTNPSVNQAYYNTIDKKAYIWNGSSWSILVQDGTNGISLNWIGIYSSHPTSPNTNTAYYNSTDKKAYIWNGTAWNILAQDGAVGPEGPLVTGSLGQTLFHNGTTWSATNSITINGQNIGIGNLLPDARLVIKGEATSLPENPIMKVRNSNDKVITETNNNGVRIYSDDNVISNNRTDSIFLGSMNKLSGIKVASYSAISDAKAGIFSATITDATVTHNRFGISGVSYGNGSGNHYGVYGYGSGLGQYNYGVVGITDNVGNQTYGTTGSYNMGGYFEASNNYNGNCGVIGYSYGSFGYDNLGGLFKCEVINGLYNEGIYAKATNGATNYGIYAEASGGTTNYAGYFSGSVKVTGTFSNPSDKNLKNKITPIKNALNKVVGLNGVTFEWKSDNELTEYTQIRTFNGKREISSFNFPKGLQYGVIAQEVEKVIPELVVTDSDGLKSVDYIKITPLLIEAIKEQQLQIDSLKEYTKKLESKLEEIIKLKTEF